VSIDEIVCPEGRGEYHDWLNLGHEVRCTYCQKTIEEVVGETAEFSQCVGNPVDSVPVGP
jgi:hypothetical protein